MSRTRRRTRLTAQPPTSSGPTGSDRPLVVAAASAGIALALYVATAARDIVVADPTEFVIASLTGGVAHPPGYPLLTLLGRAFAILPIEPAPFRVSLVSVVAGAASVAVVALTSSRLGAPAPSAILGALVFATSAAVWRWSVVAEAFPLNDLLVAGIVLSLVVWRSRPRAGLPLVATGLLGGLALTDHQTSALIAPGVLVALWQGRAALRERPLVLAMAAAAFVLGLAPYAYVPLASATDPAWSWGRVGSAADLWALITRQSYGTTQLVADATLRGGTALERLGLLVASYRPLEGVVVVLGAWAAFARQRWYLWRTVTALALAGPGFIAYADIDPARSVNAVILERFFLLPHTLTAPLAGLGIAALASYAAARAGTASPRLALAAVAAATIGIAAATYPQVRPARRSRRARLRDGHPRERRGRDRPPDDGRRHHDRGRVPADRRARSTSGHARHPAAAADRLVCPRAARAASRPRDPARSDRRAEHAAPAARRESRTHVRGGRRSPRREPEGHALAVHAGPRVDPEAAPRERIHRRARARERPPPRELSRANGRAGPHPAVEQAIRGDYARPAFLVGQQYEIAKDLAQARAWYSRALAIDPQMQRAREALARLLRS